MARTCQSITPCAVETDVTGFFLLFEVFNAVHVAQVERTVGIPHAGDSRQEPILTVDGENGVRCVFYGCGLGCNANIRAVGLTECEGFRRVGHGGEDRTRIEATAEGEAGLRRGSLFDGSAKARAQFMRQFALVVTSREGRNFIPGPVAVLCEATVGDAKCHVRCRGHGCDVFEPGAIRRQLPGGEKYVAGNGIDHGGKFRQREEGFGLRCPGNAIAHARPVERAQAVSVGDDVQFVFVRIENHAGKKAIDAVQVSALARDSLNQKFGIGDRVIESVKKFAIEIGDMSRLCLANWGCSTPIWRECNACNMRGKDDRVRFLVYDKAVCHAVERVGEFAGVKRRLGYESGEHGIQPRMIHGTGYNWPTLRPVHDTKKGESIRM